MKKVIIIAAGKGMRLRPLTNNCPKGLLKVGKKTIIQHQIYVYNNFNLNDLNIIVGYKKNKINFKDVKYFYNKDYKNNNILKSLFYAKRILKDECYISYSDIIFKKNVLKKLTLSKNNISIIVDINWKKNYVNRDMHPTSEAENVIIDREDNLVDIGKDIDEKKANGEFIGLIKLNNNGCKIFKKYFDIANKNYKNKQFFNSKNIKKAYITDFLRYLILNKIKVSCLKIKNNWMEIDTIQDLSNAQSFYK